MAEKPRPISMAAATATGAPCPATPSIKAEKQKAMSRACIRRSAEMDEMELLITSNCPASTVRLKKNTAVRMIQPIGNRPVTMPSAVADNPTLTGMRYAMRVMMRVSSRVVTPAMCPFIRFTARAQKR